MVGEAIGQMLPMAVAIAANPIPVTVVVLMLVSPRARVNGPAFALGWLAGIAVLVVMAARKWSGRPGADDEVEMPGWMGAIDAFGPLKAAGVGLGISAVNPKNLLIAVGAAATEAQDGLSAGEQAIAWATFTVIASAGVIAPVVVTYALGGRAPALLDRIKVWLIRNTNPVVAVLCLIIGALLIGAAIEGFSS